MTSKIASITALCLTPPITGGFCHFSQRLIFICGFQFISTDARDSKPVQHLRTSALYWRNFRLRPPTSAAGLMVAELVNKDGRHRKRGWDCILWICFCLPAFAFQLSCIFCFWKQSCDRCGLRMRGGACWRALGPHPQCAGPMPTVPRVARDRLKIDARSCGQFPTPMRWPASRRSRGYQRSDTAPWGEVFPVWMKSVFKGIPCSICAVDVFHCSVMDNINKFRTWRRCKWEPAFSLMCCCDSGLKTDNYNSI